ncbi:hypothetical protein POM88_047281 [Heracleum sosnowskyi]|uniref:Telomeric repeat-binding factor n=1 Tax=Heracleum sosnowskyi TaxID=360622 RepID=A0AAD8GTT7_9APIA|nr:hypothetical protein POM88_047281 [Heracleum sosnowskyi]
MGMDKDVARWVLDFLVRQPLDDKTLAGLLNTLPVQDSDSNLKKLLILRNIEDELSNGVVSETLLDLLEKMEELEFRNNVKVSEALKKAYCDVAVECTVRVLDNEGLERCFEMVKTVWRKIGSMVECKNAGLVSYDLINWKEDIEKAIWDDEVCKAVLEKWKKMDVFESVREYVKDAREKMGPSFLEVVFEKLSDEALKEVFGFEMEEDEDTIEATNATEAINATEAGLKSGNKTASDKSTDGAAGPPSGPQLPTSKKRAVSPVKRDENPKPLRRKRKPWSNVEEETLRAGVKKYGAGNWKLIWKENDDIFDERTAVDLKDKWRNLIV